MPAVWHIHNTLKDSGRPGLGMASPFTIDSYVFARPIGQDVERGTFSHRHAVMKVEDSEILD